MLFIVDFLNGAAHFSDLLTLNGELQQLKLN